MKNKEIKTKHLEEAMEYLRKSKINDERKIVALRGCSNKQGGVEITYDCGDENCYACTNVRNIINHQIENIFELMKSEAYKDIINI